jgi:predicted kinase
VPRLILVNGPPGCGKSTLASMYVDRHPLALNLDIDRVRDMLGQWRLRSSAAGVLARAIALAGARTHLIAGHDVVIPQYLGRLEFVSQLSDLAADVGARFHEVVLMDSKESSVARGAGRASDAELALMHGRLLAVIAARPLAAVVWTRAGRVCDAYRDFTAALSRGAAE